MANGLSVSSTSRRSFLSLSAAASGALSFRIVTEPMLARAARKTLLMYGVKIDKNENPLGRAASAREAAAAVIPQGGRYSDWLTGDLVERPAAMGGLKPEQDCGS